MDFPAGAGFAGSAHLKQTWRQAEARGAVCGSAGLPGQDWGSQGHPPAGQPQGSSTPIMPGWGFLMTFCSSNHAV